MQAASTSTATASPQDFHFAPEDELNDLGAAASRFKHNVAAITLLKRLEGESREPGAISTEEQRTLARYTGWGDSEVLDRAFPDGTYSWSRPRAELEALLTPDEIKSLLASSLNAHFTALPIIRAVYAALDYYGIAPATDGRILELESGHSVSFSSSQKSRLRILEPAAGVGHFLGAMPQALKANSERVAVEIDSLTGRILQRLYPRTRVFIQPFEETPLPENYFDLVVSNVPFGNYAVADAGIRENSLKASIHDYFFARSLRLVKPGGIIAFVTSRYTLDKQSPKVRRHLASHAELLAAARLPRTAFRASAGTAVVTDVLILRKRAQPFRDVDADWTETGRITLHNEDDDEVEVTINNLFIAHPEWMLGRLTAGRGMYGRDEFLLDGDGRNLGASLAEALIAQLPAGGHRQFAVSDCREVEAISSDREDFFATAGCSDLSERDRACVEELLEIYVAAKELIRLQLGDAPDEEIQAKQRELSGLYARFTMRFGPINRNVRKLHPHSPVVPFLKALEVPAGKDRYTRAPIFTERTIRPTRAQRGECSSKEALLISLNDVGRVDLDAIVRLCGQPLDAVLAALDGLIFETTEGQYVTAEEYLSGEVRQKLREAELAAQFNPAFEKNVAALKAVQPADLGRDEIIVRLGAAWVPETAVREFVTSLVPSFSGTVRYIPALAVWKIEDSGAWARSSVEANQTWGTSRVNAFELIEDILNLRTTTVTDEIVDADGNTRRVVNDNETIAAQAKQLEIKQRFAEWVWKNDSRAALLIQIYNERFNAFRKREYDGSHLVLPGMSAGITLYPHQRNAIWRILSDKATLLAHCVGAGKTFTMIAAAMELKRLGLCHKAMAVVPNHLPAQWEAEARRLYPNINVLAPAKEELSASQRGELMSRISTGDWDLIVIPHSSFKMLPVASETIGRYIQREIDTLQDYLESIPNNERHENSRTLKEIQKAIKRLDVKLKDCESAIRRDSKHTITWEELGVDALFVDEAHLYKNLYCPTKMRNVAGLPTADSQRAFDAFIKVRSLLDGGGRVVFATATPVSNTLAEVYVMMKFLQFGTLEEMGIAHFDAWTQLFAETSQGLEMKPDASGYRVMTRFNKFTNLPELAAIWRQVLDVKNADQLNLPRPKIAGGAPQVITIPASPELKHFVKNLAARVEAIKSRRVPPEVDNMLKITTEGRKAALDIRLVMPDAPRQAYSKVEAVADKVAEYYRQSQSERGAQLLFLDVSVPRRAG